MKLFVVPTPIGNLADMTYRAVQVLQQVDCILCEDTRTSGVLLKHYNITTSTRSFHQHNEHHSTPKIIDEIVAGRQFAIISDAGTPGISDAAYLLIRACVQHNIQVECLPGATALVPAVVSSGIPCDAFTYLGFLPQKKGRHTLFTALASHAYTIVFYESPHRLAKTLTELCTYFGNERQVCVARELSKKFEEYKRGTIQELAAFYTEHGIKGEVVVVVEAVA
ncbi:MAG: rRNA ((1402)-2-O)-methyltransferase [Bacteroidota bacterium]|jgi:16S rRNA (cytidine1402-2'-O)-methyltransferase